CCKIAAWQLGCGEAIMQDGAVLQNRYRLERLLGRGGMADVYLAFDLKRQVLIALKVLREDLAEDPEFVRRFQREAEALARLDHPYIVRFYSFERQGNTAFIVMDYVAGTTLRGRLMELGGPLPLQEVTRIVRQIGTALQYAHNEGFIHRDIKPGNIMLREDGTALLSDFGIARASDAATMTMGPLGTPAYMSPEQIVGREPSPQTDIYCLGIVMFEMVTGRRPFVGETGTGTSTTERMRYEHLHAQPPDPRLFNAALPGPAAGVILRALAKEASERWPDVMSLVRAWEGALGLEHESLVPGRRERTDQVPPVTPPPVQTPPRTQVAPVERATTVEPTAVAGPTYRPPPPPRKRSNLLFLLLAGAAVLLLGGGALCIVLVLAPSTPTATAVADTATAIALADTATAVVLAADTATATVSPTETPTRETQEATARPTLPPPTPTEPPPANPLEITSDTAWLDDRGNISIVGEAVNASQQTIDTLVLVEATLTDESGNVVEGDFHAYLDRPVIAPGEKSSFWVMVQSSDLKVDAKTVAEYKLNLQITEEPSPDVELVVEKSEAVQESGRLYIRGSVLNQTALEFVALSVYSTIYNTEGKVVNVTLDNIELDTPLAPGASADFEGYFPDRFDEAESFYVIVTGWTKDKWG
ncbi:MAG: protein kinase domain-containing protein, partial [Anaerolineae bacterium]